MKRRLTVAQAIIAFVKNQHSRRDGEDQRFFAGCFGIFGHGNVAGIGQALEQETEFPYFLYRNEQAMVHTAAGFAKMSNRLRTMACTTSIGPGATNMVTGAALATINRLPVLLLPGDIFARRNVAPVLQQLESASTQDISVNDCFKPVSRYWDRINRPEQILTGLPEAMRVLTSPSETGAVTLALPQDVQAEAFEYPVEFFEKRVWTIPRPHCDRELLSRAAQWIRAARRPLMIAGGGVIYSEANNALAAFVTQTGIPVAETQAGKGALAYDHPQELGAMQCSSRGSGPRILIGAGVSLVVFLRGVNVGGNRTFCPSILAKGLSDYGVVNVGAAGTFVVRKPGSKAKFRAALLRKLPFEAEVVICDGRDLIRLEMENPFRAEPSRPDLVRFVSILSRAGGLRAALPVTFPPDGGWLVRVMASKEQFVYGVYRRHMKTIGYLGRIDTLFGVPATTRNWNTILAVVRILKGQEKKAADQSRRNAISS